MKWGASNFNVQIIFLGGGNEAAIFQIFRDFFPVILLPIVVVVIVSWCESEPLAFYIFRVHYLSFFFLDRFSKTSFIVVHLS